MPSFLKVLLGGKKAHQRVLVSFIIDARDVHLEMRMKMHAKMCS